MSRSAKGQPFPSPSQESPMLHNKCKLRVQSINTMT